MKAKELRLGNWVTIDNKECYRELKNIPMYILGIKERIYRDFPKSSHSITVQNDIKKHSYSQFNDFIKPIPLTEEWLLEFGFYKLDKYTFVKDGLFVYHRKRGFVTGSTKREIKLQYVHKLQNWYHTFTEKELQNPF